MTKTEIEEKLVDFCTENPEHEFDHVLLAVKKAFNLGVQLSADNAETEEEPYTYCQECMQGSVHVDRESILKLKIK